MIYVWLQSPDLAVQRVAKRVRAGGHNIPEEIIRRRYERGRTNFFSLYKDLADEWLVVDNTLPEPVTVARMNQGQLQILQPQQWESISKEEI